MPRLLLVRHALPDIKPDAPAETWVLSERGRAQSRALAEVLRPYHPNIVITSDEPKATETGRIAAEVLGLPCHTAPDLHERVRGGEPYFDNLAEFEAAMKVFFDEPDERKYGGESANEAQRRFVGAVGKALEPHPKKDVVVVAHGTVNTLFVAAHSPVAPFELWRAWPLGGLVALSHPNFRLLGQPAPLATHFARQPAELVARDEADGSTETQW